MQIIQYHCKYFSNDACINSYFVSLSYVMSRNFRNSILAHSAIRRSEPVDTDVESESQSITFGLIRFGIFIRVKTRSKERTTTTSRLVYAPLTTWDSSFNQQFTSKTVPTKILLHHKGMELCVFVLINYLKLNYHKNAFLLMYYKKDYNHKS